MKTAFIWVSGLSFIDKKKLLMARNLFGFLAKNKPVQRFRKTNNIPGANWLQIWMHLQTFHKKCKLALKKGKPDYSLILN